MLSFWETTHFTHFDYIIVGSGITGLSAAATLLEEQPQTSVLVLERGILPTGASTKNAGFACFGSLTELLADLQNLSEPEMVALVTQRWSGLQKLRNRLGDAAIDFRNYGGYELLFEKELPALEHLHRINRLLYPVFEGEVFYEQPEKIGAFGFKHPSVKSMVFNRFEGQIDTGKMMKSLWHYVQAKGGMVWNNLPVTGFSDQGNKVVVKAGSGGKEMQLTCSKLAICTNAFTQSLLPGVWLKPGRGQVLVTQPIENLPFRGTFHFDEGYYYFRNYQDRIIFGGGRNLDFQGEATLDFDTTAQIRNHLTQKLHELICPGLPVEIAQWWAGIMAFGNDKKPVIEKHSANVAIGVRLGGMGVAIGSNVGEKVAHLLLAP